MAAAAGGDKVQQALGAIRARHQAIEEAPEIMVPGRPGKPPSRRLSPAQSVEIQSLKKLGKRIERIPTLYEMRDSLNPQIGKIEEEKLEHETRRLQIGSRYIGLCEESYGKQTCLNKVDAELAATLKEVDKILGIVDPSEAPVEEDPLIDELVGMFDRATKMGGGYRKRRHTRRHRKVHRKSRRHHRKSRRHH